MLLLLLTIRILGGFFTGHVIRKRSLEDNPRIVANHPFTFKIASSLELFGGRYLRPVGSKIKEDLVHEEL